MRGLFFGVAVSQVMMANFNDFQEEINRIEEYNRTNNVPRIFLPEGVESNI
ncbi:hypothetical protein PATY110618_12110 [Paenibacillus typhae]|uniref:Uncharacterized protein n=1 Tax=Paenibacillus typhae TaxID=1174501 RepID=A0A1G8ZW08_9BACL|nr:hypothetical protein SAMN05216192_13428 [Paenibacillus typhae]